MRRVGNRVTKVTIRIKEVRWLTPRGAGSSPVRDMVIEMRIRADDIGPRASPPLHYGINRTGPPYINATVTLSDIEFRLPWM